MQSIWDAERESLELYRGRKRNPALRSGRKSKREEKWESIKGDRKLICVRV